MGSIAPSTPLTGKSIIITGGISGIGLSLTHHFASTSNSISILDISSPASPQTLTTLTTLQSTYPLSKIIFKQCDISNWENIRAAFEETYKEFEVVDLVVANAGVTEIGKVLGDELDENGGLKMPNLKTLDVDLVGTIYSIKLAVRYMRKNPGPQKGSIVCTASNAGLYPFPIAPLYAISKHAVVGAVRSFAKPLEGDGIRINAICPNVIETSLADDNLFAHMTITPMSTLINAVQELVTNESLSGITAEVSGEKFTFRDPPEYVDEISRKNLDAFWALGYA